MTLGITIPTRLVTDALYTRFRYVEMKNKQENSFEHMTKRARTTIINNGRTYNTNTSSRGGGAGSWWRGGGGGGGDRRINGIAPTRTTKDQCKKH